MYRLSKEEIRRYLILAGLLASDQLLKFVIMKYTTLPIYINSGISFSLLPFLPWTLIVMGVLITSSIFLSHFSSTGLILVLGGGISNLLDRFQYRGVVDYLDLKILPVFNLADIMITIGMIVIIWEILHRK